MNSDLYNSTVCIRFKKSCCVDGDPEVNVTKEIGKFYQNKNNGHIV
jgi:hypothetical protein